MVNFSTCSIQHDLCAWYEENARDLPWRVRPTLYGTVVSEFMLQQTQVTTVLPRFEAWMKRFPDFGALATAGEDEVMAAWEGLGYYTRARNLRKLAIEFLRQDAAMRPRAALEWQKMPGVGPYTAAAIASIAFGQPVAVVDGNVVRVIVRLTGSDDVFSSTSEAVAAVRPTANALIDGCERPGDFNQALMELGATICSPRSPVCAGCPLKSYCKSAHDPRACKRPAIQRRKPVARVIRRALVVNSGCALLQQVAKEQRRLGGLWEFPAVDGFDALDSKPVFKAKRHIAGEVITEEFYRCRCPGSLANRADFRWQPADGPLAMTGPHRRWLKRLLLDSDKCR